MTRIEIYKNLKDLGVNASVIIDCGAAYGEWSTQISSVFPEAFVIGIDANDWTQCEKIPGATVTEICALSDENGKQMSFYRKKEHCDTNTFCTGDSLFKEDTQHYQAHNTVVNTVTTRSLESVLQKYGKNKVDIIKLDTQGSELLILKGLGDKLRDVEFIELECSLVEYNIGGCSFYDVIDFLKDSFNVYDIVELHRHYNTHLCQVDIIFQNKNSKIQKLK